MDYYTKNAHFVKMEFFAGGRKFGGRAEVYITFARPRDTVCYCSLEQTSSTASSKAQDRRCMALPACVFLNLGEAVDEVCSRLQ